MLTLFMALALATDAGSAVWQTEHDEVACRALKSPVAASNRAQLILLSRDVLGRDIHIEVMPPADTAWKDRGLATLRVSGSDRSVANLKYTSRTLPDGQKVISVEIPAIALLHQSVEETYSLNEDSQAPLELPGLKLGLDQLRQCRDSQLSNLSIDASEADDTIFDAVGTSSQWITDNDVPRQRIIPVNYRGYMIWRVEINGRTSNCRFAQSTGDIPLDNHLCRLMTRNGRYAKPAINSSGTPTPKWHGRWMLVRF